MDEISRSTYEFGGFRLNPGAHSLVGPDGAPIELPSRAFDALLCLVQRAGQVVDKATLLRVVWPRTVVEDNSLYQCVLAIRRALGDDGAERRFVITLPGRGFQFVAPVRLVPEALEAKFAAEPAPPARRSAGPRSSHILRTALVGLAVIGLLSAGFLWRSSGSSVDPLDYVPLTDVADSATAPALSPDGRLLAFIRNGQAFLSRGQIWLKRLPDGEPIQLTHESGPIFAPTFTSDGTRVAYSVVTADTSTFSWDTFTVPITGGEPELLLPNASGLSYIGPHEVMYSEFHGVGVHLALATSLEDRAQHREIYLPAHERGMAHFSYLSPDRRSVLLVEMGGDGDFDQCRLLPFDGSNSGSPVGPDGACVSAAWSADGRWMYFSAQTAKGMHIWRQRYPDGTPQQITSFPGDEESVIAASDGTSLLASVGLEQTELWIHDARGERRLTSEGVVRNPWLSADGRRIYYIAERRTGGNREDELRRVDVDTGRSTMLLNGFNVRSFDVSNDEHWAAFARTNGVSSEIWIAPLDRSSAPRKLLAGADQVHFDRDNRIYFRRIDGRVNYLERTDLDGTAPTRLSEDPILILYAVAPDGRFAVVARVVGETGGNFLQPLSGGAPLLIDHGWWPARWSHDGATLFIEVGLTEHSERGGRTRAVPLGSDGLPIEKLHPQPADAIFVDRAVSTLAIGNDPSTYAFVSTKGSRNIYRIPLP